MKAAAGSNLKKVTLELGGKSPNIVFDDADIENAISWVNFGIFFNHGQCCCAGSRVYVQEGIYDKFVQRFKERTNKSKSQINLTSCSSLFPSREHVPPPRPRGSPQLYSPPISFITLTPSLLWRLSFYVIATDADTTL